MKNRLDLNFDLLYQDERAKYVNEYVSRPEFIEAPLTSAELETISTYILYGVDRESGLSESKKKNILLSTKNSVWSKKENEESLEELRESPNFNEGKLRPITAPPLRIQTEEKRFSREKALQSAPSYLRGAFEDLFRRIDHVDLLVGFYEQIHGRKGKEVKPPREELLRRFTDEEIEEISLAARDLSPHTYLKKKRELVTLRTEQYTLKDSYAPLLLTSPLVHLTNFDTTNSFEAGIEVLPLGLSDHTSIARLLYRPDTGVNMRPRDYSTSDLEAISKFYWKKQNFDKKSHKFYFDFRNQEHVYLLLNLYTDLEGDLDRENLDSTLPSFLKTLRFYIKEAQLTDAQREILRLKILKKSNQDISKIIGEKFGKTYAPNYISTIFTRKIVQKICEAAQYHETVVSQIFFEEEFKECTCCGRTLLRDTVNFMRKGRSADGLMARCKACEKKIRGEKANANE
jgi:hypothetical protein